MRIGVYPGSFDPITLGHLDVIKRALKVVDKLIIGVLENGSKTPMFTVEDRIDLIQTACEEFGDAIEVVSFSGLLVDFLRQQGATINVRGLRTVSDYEYELQMAQANQSLYPEMETIFLPTGLEYAFISSTIVKDVLKHGGDISRFVPENILEKIYTPRR